MKIVKATINSLIIILLVLTNSCKSDNNLKIDVSKTPNPNLKIKRYEQAIFNIPADSFIYKIGAFQKDFPLFLNGDLSDTNSLLQLKSFCTDNYMIQLNNEVQKQYPKLDEIEAEFNAAFMHYKHYFPQGHIPVIYSYVSGLDFEFPIKYATDNLLIGLDMYLGENFDAYSVSGFSKYRTHWAVKEAIVSDAMLEVASGILPENSSSDNLLQLMIYQGKRLYFMKSMCPEISDTLLFKYTINQLKWVNDYEGKVWSTFLENKLLYNNDKKMIKKFMEDGPFTDIFSKDSPARIGYFIGFQIVKNYMTETNSSLSELIKEVDSQKILKLSHYKPKL
ncbi:MAG: hypothetical protein AUJ98_11320 [Bacteroidetes bacterium CG2_30_33_31]|nr:MAG: hypothetical protein AUJ98_11320 [Bacteroidetes bacterium CG2_30_33_31]